MSSVGAQAGALAIAMSCHWPCRPSACANQLSSCRWLSSSCAPRRSSNGYHAVLSIIRFSLVDGPQRRPPARGQRGPGACSGCTCRVTPPYSEQCSTVKNSVHHSGPDPARHTPKERNDVLGGIPPRVVPPRGPVATKGRAGGGPCL